MSGTYDIAIIGAGAAGLIAADFAVKLGARVALLEKDRIGGDCTWTGCVPSKSLLHVAKIAQSVRSFARYGIVSEVLEINMPQVQSYLNGTIDQIYAGTTPEALRTKGMDILLGAVQFVDPKTISAGDQQVKADRVLICTGAIPHLPEIGGLDSAPYSTYLDIFTMDRLPKSLAIVGGGPIGAELAQAYARLGVEVTVFADRFLSTEEPEASAIVEQVLHQEGIRFVHGCATRVQRVDGRISVSSEMGSAECEKLLIANGRKPRVSELNLAAAGVEFSPAGLRVNSRLQTSVPHIYGAGDVLGVEQFSHYAGWQGFQAARNALLPGSNDGFSAILPRVTFTDPEVAQIGILEHEAKVKHGDDCCVGSMPLSKVDRAVCEDDRHGFVKIIAKANGEILGGTIVGNRAGEAIMELVMAMRRKISLNELASIIHPYPTYSSALQLLATDMAMQRAFRGVSGKVLRTASRFAR